MSLELIYRWTGLTLSAGLITTLLSSCNPTTSPVIRYAYPDTVDQGGGASPNSVPISIVGYNLGSCGGPVVFDSGIDQGLSGTVTATTSTQVDMTLTATPTANVGHHVISLDCGDKGGIEVDIGVICAACPPLPTLSSVAPAPGSSLPVQGYTSQVRFTGSNFELRSPVVELDPQDAGGLTFDPSAPIVHRQGTTDYFELPLIIDSSARSGSHRVRVRTTDGSTEWQPLYVEDVHHLLTPPGGILILTDVTPAHVSPGADVLIECHGKGFGSNREVILTPVLPFGGPTPSPIPITTYPMVNTEADRDSLVVARIHPAEAAIVKVQVRNIDLNATTDDVRIFVEPLEEGAIVGRTSASDAVHRGGNYLLTVSGENLSNVTDYSWGGIPGLTFSNTSATATSASVTIHADAAAPLTGNAATNLVLVVGNNTNRQRRAYSFPFSFSVVP